MCNLWFYFNPHLALHNKTIIFTNDPEWSSKINSMTVFPPWILNPPSHDSVFSKAKLSPADKLKLNFMYEWIYYYHKQLDVCSNSRLGLFLHHCNFFFILTEIFQECMNFSLMKTKYSDETPDTPSEIFDLKSCRLTLIPHHSSYKVNYSLSKEVIIFRTIFKLYKVN